MDKRIRRNEVCVIGQPSCDNVFSSTRTCFIGYGFGESNLEMEVLRGLLKEKEIETIEAGGKSAPAQNAFCAKICSKIITSQFCIILLNHQYEDGREIPNANVNMEYGLMLGFNKYVIPFQKESQKLPFNVAGLDTVKYTIENFRERASSEIDQILEATKQETLQPIAINQKLDTFILIKGALIVQMDEQGHRNLFSLGQQLGFNLLVNFEGMKYIYFGNYTRLVSENIYNRINLLNKIVEKRFSSIRRKQELMPIPDVDTRVSEELYHNMEIWIAVTGEVEKNKLHTAFLDKPPKLPLYIFTMDEISEVVSSF